MKLCFAADLHGRSTLYKQLYDLITTELPGALILGGDQCPLAFGPTAEVQQRTWLETIFRAFLEALAPICPVYWNSGNHDLAAMFDTLAKFEHEGQLFLCDMKSHPIGENVYLTGFPYGPISGWPLADWALLDEGQSLQDWQDTVYATLHGHLTQARMSDTLAARPSLSRKMAELEVEDSSASILVCHYPPFGSGLDLNPFEHSVGSRALASYIAGHNYPLSLHGHVHEAPYLCGHWVRRGSETASVNPGQWGDKLHAIVFEWPNPAHTLRHTLFGHTWRVEAKYDAISMRKELEMKWNLVR